MIIVNINPEETYARAAGLWQYDYGQALRIQGLSLPPAIEIHFSLQETGGEAITRIGVTKDGVTDVVIPDYILDGAGAIEDYFAYAFIYPSDENSGQTEHRIEIGVKSRPKPEGYKGSGDDTMGAVMNAINEIAAGKADGLEYKNSILRLMSGETELAQVTISGGSGGENGITPHIGENGNWYLGEADTGVKASGSDGITPHIGDNGNWYIGETDTGVKAEAPSTDSTLTESGKAADAKITGEKISELKSDLGKLSEEVANKSGLTNEIKTALLNWAKVVAYSVDNGIDYYTALENALNSAGTGEEEPGETTVPATSITLDISELSFDTIGESYVLSATVMPLNSTDVVTWESSNINVATVSSNGTVTAVANGTCTITVTAGSISAICSVTVAGIMSPSIPNVINYTVTQGNVTASNSNPSQVSFVLTDVNIASGGTLSISVNDGYQLLALSHSSTTASSKAGSYGTNAIYYTLTTISSGYVGEDTTSVFSANAPSGWLTSTPFTIKNGATVDKRYSHIGFLVRKSDVSDLTPEEAETVVHISGYMEG